MREDEGSREVQCIDHVQKDRHAVPGQARHLEDCPWLWCTSSRGPRAAALEARALHALEIGLIFEHAAWVQLWWLVHTCTVPTCAGDCPVGRPPSYVPRAEFSNPSAAAPRTALTRILAPVTELMVQSPPKALGRGATVSMV